METHGEETDREGNDSDEEKDEETEDISEGIPQRAHSFCLLVRRHSGGI